MAVSMQVVGLLNEPQLMKVLLKMLEHPQPSIPALSAEVIGRLPAWFREGPSDPKHRRNRGQTSRGGRVAACLHGSLDPEPRAPRSNALHDMSIQTPLL